EYLEGEQLHGPVSVETATRYVAIKPSPPSLELGSPRALFSLQAVFNGSYSCDVAPDGPRILVFAFSNRRRHGPLSVIVNWPGLVRGSRSAGVRDSQQHP